MGSERPPDVSPGRLVSPGRDAARGDEPAPAPDSLAFAEPPRSLRDRTAYRCATCDKYVDEGDLKRVHVRGDEFIRACPACGMAVFEERSREARSFVSLLPAAFKWPFHKESLVALGVLALFGFVCDLFFGTLSGTVEFAICVMYLLAIVRSTGQGNMLPPHAVDWVNASDLVRPVFRLMLAYGIGSAPLSFAFAVQAPWFLIALTALISVLYFPAGFLIAAHADGWFAPLNLVRVARIASRTGKDYFISAVVTGVLLVVASGVYQGLDLLRTYVKVPLLPNLLFHFGWLIAPTIMARVLGTLVREHAHEL